MNAAALCPLLAVSLAFAQDSTFLLQTDKVAPYTRSFLANGVFSTVVAQVPTRPLEGFMARLYDRPRDDIPRFAALPAWTEIDLSDGREWLNAAPLESLNGYRQSLNMYDGTLHTSFVWNQIGVESEILVSRESPYLGAVEFALTPRVSGRLTVTFALRGWPAPKRGPEPRWYPGHMEIRSLRADPDGNGSLLRMISRPEGEDTTVALAAAVGWPAGLKETEYTAQGQLAEVRLSFQAEAGRTYRFVKCVGVVSSFDSADPPTTARDTARTALQREFRNIRQDHASAWHELWSSDIVVDGHPQLQTVLHSMQFYLLSSVRGNTDFSIPPMGLSSAGYYGHIFWDADTFMLPFLLAQHPDLARSLVMFRYRTLAGAEANARKRGFKGAAYPWEADWRGDEVIPKFAERLAISENHVTGAVARGMWQFYLATGDRDWLRRYGYPVLSATADYWVSRATYDAQEQRYRLRDVIGVDESQPPHADDPYTDALAQQNLDLALTAARVLGERPQAAWEKVSFRVIEDSPQALLLDYPLEIRVSPEKRRALLEGVLKKDPGVLMLTGFHPLQAAELGDAALAQQLLERSYRPYLQPPFNVISETPGSDAVSFVTGAGAFLQQFLFGYAGLRLREQGFMAPFKPLLPASIRKLTIKGVDFRGRRADVIVEGGKLRLVAVQPRREHRLIDRSR